MNVWNSVCNINLWNDQLEYWPAPHIMLITEDKKPGISVSSSGMDWYAFPYIHCIQVKYIDAIKIRHETELPRHDNRSQVIPLMKKPIKLYSWLQQGHSQTLNPGWARKEHFLNFSSFSCILSYFSSIFLYSLHQFSSSGGRVAHPGRPWLRHCMGCRKVACRMRCMSSILYTAIY